MNLKRKERGEDERYIEERDGPDALPCPSTRIDDIEKVDATTPRGTDLKELMDDIESSLRSIRLDLEVVHEFVCEVDFFASPLYGHPGKFKPLEDMITAENSISDLINDIRYEMKKV